MIGIVVPGVMLAFAISPYMNQFRGTDGTINHSLIDNYQDPKGFRPIDLTIYVFIITPMIGFLIRIYRILEIRSISKNMIWLTSKDFTNLPYNKGLKLGKSMMKIRIEDWMFK